MDLVDQFATYALLDTGSVDSFIAQSLVDRMKVKEKSSEALTVCTLNGEATVNVGKVDVVVEPLNNPEVKGINIEDAKVVDNLNIKPYKGIDLSNWAHLEDVDISEID